MIFPAPSPATEPFWAGARAHRLRLPRCASCRRWRHPRAPGCPCGAADTTWEDASGRGTLASFTVVRRALHPALSAAIPYTILLVRLDEDVQLVSGMAGEARNLQVGQRLAVWFDDIDGEITLPRFAPSDGAGHGTAG